MVINRVRLRNAVLRMEKLNIALNVKTIHVTNINTLMNMIRLLLIGTGKQI